MDLAYRALHSRDDREKSRPPEVQAIAATRLAAGVRVRAQMPCDAGQRAWAERGGTTPTEGAPESRPDQCVQERGSRPCGG